MDALLERKISVVVSNLALPIERMFGNYGALTQQSLYGSVLAFNNLLAEAVKTRRSCSMNDVMFIANRFGSENFFDERLWLSSKAPCAYRFLPEIARSISRIVAVNRGKAKKVLVLDLDNTIWGGVIGDDGMDGIALGGDAFGEAFQQFQKYVLGLRDRGFVLAVCSKNNEATAIEPFRSHPEMLLNETDISVFVANWNDKAGNIDYISRVLSLGRDSFIFIDDSAFERDQVANAHPMVAVPEIPEDVAGYISAIEWSGLLEAQSFTAEDATRNDSYRVEAQRTTEQLRFSDIGEYLASLEMKITAEPFGVADLPRVAQLIQRSNQFNLRTQRLSEADCESAAKLNHVTLSARLSDKFGDYGLISVVVGEPDGDSLFIKELVMSCRVLRRGVEEYLMNTLFSEAALRGFSGIKGEYIASAKNKMVEGFYRDFGFDLISDPSDLKRTVWYLATSDYAPRKTHIQRVTT
jgi:FkbH-like protein